MKAVAAELQTQVDDLNDERVRLLKKLRDGAGASGGGASRGGEGGEGDGEERQDVSRFREYLDWQLGGRLRPPHAKLCRTCW